MVPCKTFRHVSRRGVSRVSDLGFEFEVLRNWWTLGDLCYLDVQFVHSLPGDQLVKSLGGRHALGSA
jgi:hypothetical protein